MNRIGADHIRPVESASPGAMFFVACLFVAVTASAGIASLAAAIGEPLNVRHLFSISFLDSNDDGDDGSRGSRGDSNRLPLAAVWELSEEPVVLDGYTDIAEFEVALPVGWELQGTASFNAAVHASEIAGDDAALRVDIAGRPVTSWRIDDGAELNVDVPPNSLGHEPVQVSVSTTSPLIIEATCPDPNHVGRWFDIGRPVVSAAILPVAEMTAADAIRGMARVSSLTREPVVLSAGADPSPGALNALGAMIAAVGQNGRPHDWLVHDLDDDNVPPGSRIVLTVDADLEARVRVDSTGARPVLHLEGDEQSIAVLAQALADPDRLLFFDAPDVALARSGVPAAAVSIESEVFTFADGGYGPRTLRGYGTQGLQYQVRLPAEVVPDKAVISLDGSFGPQLGNHEAAITVTINGGDPDNVALADQSGRLGVLYDLDPSDLRPGLNYIGVHVQLGIPRAPCSAVIGAEPSWLTLSPTSALAIRQSSEDGEIEASVSELRFALASPRDFVKTDVVVGTGDRASLDHAADLIGEMAFRAGSGAPRLVKENNLDEGRHLVLVGGVDREDLMDQVPQVDSGVDLGIASITSSPLASNRVLIAFTGGTAKGLSRTLEAAMSSEVNHIDREAGLVGNGIVRNLEGDPSAIDDPAGIDPNLGRSLDQPPNRIPYVDIPGPSELDYEEWILKQATKIATARAPETDARRAIAIGMLLAVAVLGGVLYILKLRKENDGDADAGHH